MCEHEPDWSSTTSATPIAGLGFPPGEHAVLGVTCKKCGIEGTIVLHLNNIDW